MSRPAISTRAPTVSGRKISSPAMSNERLVTATRQSLASRPGLVFIEARKLVSARWGISTPLGVPVDPEV